VRRLGLLLAAGTIWLFLLAGATFADNGPHVAGSYTTQPTTDSCAGCHRAHTAQAPMITLQEQPGLCYSCHGAGTMGAATDVQDGAYYSDQVTLHTGPNAGALRGGGIDYALIQTNTYGTTSGITVGVATAAAPTTSHHSVDESPVVMWGNGAYGSAVNYGKGSVDLSCGSCHDPHGNHQYRILKPAPNDSGIGQNTRASNWSAGGRVFINDATAKTYTTTNFRVPDPGFASPANLAGDGTGEGYNGGPADGSLVALNTTTHNWYGAFAETSGQWCASCHTRYNALSGAYAVDSGDPVFKYQHAAYKLINPVTPGTAGTTTGGGFANWISTKTSDYPTADAGTVTAVTGTFNKTGTTTHAPMCLTCHVSHGTDATMTSKITNQFSPGVNLSGTGSAQVIGPLDSQNDRNVALGSTLLMLNNRGVCESCHNK
jgi:predicted CXXCH cytochrome family protein